EIEDGADRIGGVDVDLPIEAAIGIFRLIAHEELLERGFNRKLLLGEARKPQRHGKGFERAHAWRPAVAAKRAIAAAFDTLSDLIGPGMSSRTISSQSSRVRWRRPLPSAPSTTAMGVSSVRGRSGASASESKPRTVRPRSLS